MKINKFKFTRAIVCFVLVMTGLVQFGGYVFGDARKADIEYKTVVVGAGDSLWSIAEDFNKRGDIREKIDEIKEFNNLSSSTVYKNQVLKVPVE